MNNIKSLELEVNYLKAKKITQGLSEYEVQFYNKLKDQFKKELKKLKDELEFLKLKKVSRGLTQYEAKLHDDIKAYLNKFSSKKLSLTN